MPINLTDTISRSDGLAQRMFEERMLVITAKDSKLHRFNDAGTFIWNQLERPKSVNELLAGLVDHFSNIDAGQGKEDLLKFLEGLHRKGLIIVAREG